MREPFLLLITTIALTLALGCGDDSSNVGPTGPTTGTIQVNVTTTGTQADPSGYTVSLDGGPGQAIAANGRMTITDVSAGEHAVTLGDLTEHCGTNTGTNPQTVTAAAGQTVQVTFVVTCMAPPQSPRIAFASNRDGNGDIYLMDPDGSNVTRLTNDPAGARDPAWAPDGVRIAFASFRDGGPGIYVMNADGSDVVRLTNEDDVNPAWSPDGQRIAFTSFRDPSATSIYVMNADGSGVTRLTTDADDQNPTWSPDGQSIAFERSGGESTSGCTTSLPGIFVMRADGSGARLLTCFPLALAGLDPAWSPDGSRIAFQGLLLADDDLGAEGIYVMNADGSDVVQLTNEDDVNPAWSSDGSRILFISSALLGADIYVIGADGTGRAQLTNTPTVEETDPAWSP